MVLINLNDKIINIITILMLHVLNYFSIFSIVHCDCIYYIIYTVKVVVLPDFYLFTVLMSIYLTFD